MPVITIKEHEGKFVVVLVTKYKQEEVVFTNEHAAVKCANNNIQYYTGHKSYYTFEDLLVI
jgi:hypothetical protein